MTPIFLRFANPDDKDQFLSWARKAGDKNHFDESELEEYHILVAERDNRVICYLPLKKFLLLESLAPNPDASTMELAMALRELVVGAKLQAESAGFKELGFWDSDAGTTRGAELMGFKRCSMPLYRRKV